MFKKKKENKETKAKIKILINKKSSTFEKGVRYIILSF